jgi:large subunit ribosomal protein L4
VRRTALIVESGAALGQNLLKGARNLVGVDLMLNNEVHPYDLLKAERVIFSRSALEKLQESLKKSAATRRKAEVA